MPESFDPYHVWLGIPPEDQPPTYYRLLGINAFESNPDVIEAGANARMTYLRTLSSGKNGQLTQRILNEVSQAKICLLQPEKKAAYDGELEATLDRETAITNQQNPLGELPEVGELVSPGKQLPEHEIVSAQPVQTYPDRVARPGFALKTQKRKSNHAIMIAAVVTGAIMFAAIGLLLVILVQRASDDVPDTISSVPDQKTVKNNPGRNSKPLRGQSATNSSASIDLLNLIDLEKHTVKGSFRKEAGDLISVDDEICRVDLLKNQDLPDAYEIKAVVTRLTQAEGLIFGLMIEGHTVSGLLDGFSDDGHRCGFNMVDLATVNLPKNPTAHKGQLLPIGQQKTIVIRMVPGDMSISVDGKVVSRFDGDTSRLKMRFHMVIAGKPPPFLATWYSSFRFSELTLRPITK